MQLKDRSYIFKAESRAGVRFLVDHHGSHQGNLITRRAFKPEKAEESKLTAGTRQRIRAGAANRHGSRLPGGMFCELNVVAPRASRSNEAASELFQWVKISRLAAHAVLRKARPDSDYCEPEATVRSLATGCQSASSVV